jgi:S-adenosylmethionine:tRNA ribosyltransferase-isomerase
LIPSITIDEYDYSLPSERIAQYPAEVRDGSRLLVWQEGSLTDDMFINIHEHLNERTLLVFNDTRVIRARMIFRKTTGSAIEVFCLEPVEPVSEIVTAFQQPSGVIWKCLIGNLKKWRSGPLTMDISDGVSHITLSVTYVGADTVGNHLIRFTWGPPELPFGKIVELAGHVPLPPYIHREAAPDDAVRYQTIFAKNDGSVAAPTAGLHFTERILSRLSGKSISRGTVTLHVGIGTFKPVDHDDLRLHTMHRERIVVSASMIRKLLTHQPHPVVAVGTTSARTLESLYWVGRRILTGKASFYPETGQWDPYDDKEQEEVSVTSALEALLAFLDQRGEEYYSGETQLLIVPGYRFRIITGLITNFHMPRSTLLLLVAAIAGHEWRRVYDFALEHGYRFLSYGDSCLFHLSADSRV